MPGCVVGVPGTDAVAVMAGLEALLARADVVPFGGTGDGGEPFVEGLFHEEFYAVACAHLGNGLSGERGGIWRREMGIEILGL